MAEETGAILLLLLLVTCDLLSKHGNPKETSGSRGYDCNVAASSSPESQRRCAKSSGSIATTFTKTMSTDCEVCLFISFVKSAERRTSAGLRVLNVL